MEDVKTVQKVERSPRGLVDALFDSLDKLNNGDQSADDVRAVCHTARSIVSVARLEIEAARLASDLGKPVEIGALPGLNSKQITGPQE
jgi:hypothetical protein